MLSGSPPVKRVSGHAALGACAGWGLGGVLIVCTTVTQSYSRNHISLLKDNTSRPKVIMREEEEEEQRIL